MVDDLRGLGSAAQQSESALGDIGVTSGNVASSLIDVGKGLVAAFAFGRVKAGLVELTHEADELEKSAMALGTSVEQLQQYRHAAGLANVSAEQLRGAFARLQRAAADSSGGAKKDSPFARLGIDVKNAQGALRPANELFDEVAEKLGAMENATERNSLAMQLFGKSGGMLLPLFAEGAEGIQKFRAEVEEFGGGITTDFASKAAGLTDELQRQDLAWLSLKIAVAQHVLPWFSKFVGGSAKMIASLAKWLRQTRLVEAALAAFSAKGVMALIKAIPILVAKMGGWRLAFATLGRFILRTMLPLIALEDLIGFFMGDDSQIGHWIDQAFGAGTQDKVREFFSVAAEQFSSFTKNSNTAYDALADDNASWLKRTLAGFALLVSDTKGFFGVIVNGWSSILLEMGIAIDEFVLRVFNAWNNMLAGMRLPSFVYTALKIDTRAAEAELAGFKARQDALEIDAYERATGTGKHEPPAAKAAREANTGVNFVRNGPGDLNEVQQALARDFARMRFGGGPGSGPFRLDDASGAPPFPVAATAAVPQSVVNDNHVDVGGVRVQQNITVPPGTTEEQARDLGRGAAGGVKDAVNTRSIEAALSHTAG